MLSFRAYGLTFAAVTTVELQSFAGSAWRGAFGHALKRACCVMRLRPCEGCMLEHGCVFPTVFAARPHPEADRMRRYPNVPQPYVLQPLTPTPRVLAPDDRFELRVVLIGRALPHVAYVVRALEQAAGHGVGRGRGRLRLASLDPLPEPPPVDPAAGRVRLHVLSPTRLVRDGRVVSPATFTAAALLMPLLRRLSMLAYFHEGRDLPLDFRALKDAAEAVPAEAGNLRWRDQTRHSGRQGRLVPMGGLVGSVDLDLRRAPDFWPLLRLGEWVHVGKGATMGLGRYRLEPLAS